MELNEAARRIFRQHWVLIVCLVLLGVGAAAIHARVPSTYTASTRLVLGTADPKSRTESGSIADTAKAIASSPVQVRQALADAHVADRDPVTVAKQHVFVRPLGTSGVVQLSVSDRSPSAAAAIANALGGRVISVRSDVIGGQAQQVLGELSDRVDDLNSQMSKIDLTIDDLNADIARTSATGTANVLRARRDEASRQREFLARQRSILESEQISVISADALRPKAAIISKATVPKHADASFKFQELILGALLGLVLGAGIAGLIETLRPTFVGSDALARQFDTPLLGTVAADTDEERAWHTLRRTALRLRLGGESMGAQTLGLVPVGPDVDLGLLAATLDELAQGVETADAERDLAAVGAVAGTPMGRVASSSAGPNLHTRATGAASSSRFRIRPFGLSNGSPDNRSTGLVLVSPSVVKKAEIDDVSHLLRVARLPVLGLITYERQRAQEPRRWAARFIAR
jgi:capsular polysaccharide biosynthesis protein